MSVLVNSPGPEKGFPAPPEGRGFFVCLVLGRAGVRASLWSWCAKPFCELVLWLKSCFFGVSCGLKGTFWSCPCFVVEHVFLFELVPPLLWIKREAKTIILGRYPEGRDAHSVPFGSFRFSGALQIYFMGRLHMEQSLNTSFPYPDLRHGSQVPPEFSAS